MRAIGRDLIRGGHYGQRSCEPHLKAEHMAAPTNAAYGNKALANSEPSTHGTKLTCRLSRCGSLPGVERTCPTWVEGDAIDSKRTSLGNWAQGKFIRAAKIYY